MSKWCSDRASNGCPTWIRTMTRRVKVACATITPSGRKLRKGHGAVQLDVVKNGKYQAAISRVAHSRGLGRVNSVRSRRSKGAFVAPACTALMPLDHAVALDCMNLDSLRLQDRIRAIQAMRVIRGEHPRDFETVSVSNFRRSACHWRYSSRSPASGTSNSPDADRTRV